MKRKKGMKDEKKEWLFIFRTGITFFIRVENNHHTLIHSKRILLGHTNRLYSTLKITTEPTESIVKMWFYLRPSGKPFSQQVIHPDPTHANKDRKCHFQTPPTTSPFGLWQTRRFMAPRTWWTRETRISFDAIALESYACFSAITETRLLSTIIYTIEADVQISSVITFTQSC